MRPDGSPEKRNAEVQKREQGMCVSIVEKWKKRKRNKELEIVWSSIWR
jgi:hypothetical protein